MEAVIHAISPTLKLRSYIETIENLKLGKLLQVLKAHYKQKSAAELYQELTVTCQGPKETAEDFLIRVLELRQQVLFILELWRMVLHTAQTLPKLYS